MAQRRAAERDIEIPRCKNPRRRKKCEKDVKVFLPTYFPRRFYNPFTADQVTMIDGILHAAVHGGKQAYAADRGGGKTTLAECVIIFCILNGFLSFPLIASSTGPDAEQILSNIKGEFETNDVLMEDYPEVCAPIRALEGANQRAGGQTVGGERTRIKWAGKFVVFPTVKGSLASGAILMTRGLDSSIRGVRVGDRRPDFVMTDDPDTDESAESPSQQEKRTKTIERTLDGLGGPGQKLGQIILCTIINRTCIAAQFTDPKVKPAWKGRRFKLLPKFPARDDLWGEFMRLRKEGKDPNSEIEETAAHEYYLANREAMDAGAEVSNPHRFNANAFPPESSTLEHCYNKIADTDLAAFLTEYNNDPPEEDSSGSGITPAIVARRISGYPLNVIPRNPLAVTAFVDVGESKGCHFATTAWYPGARGHVIEYGVQEVHGVEKLGKQRAVFNALRAWREERLRLPYVTEDGEECKVNLVMVDSGDGDFTETVYDFCAEAGRPFRPSKGFGTLHGQSPFREAQKRTVDRKPGNHWYESRQGKLWLVCFDSDFWKGFVHDRFMTQHLDDAKNLRPGSLSLFMVDQKDLEKSVVRHHSFAHHICSEERRTEFMRGHGMREKFHAKSRNNDWLDCMAGCACASDMCGVRLNSEKLAISRVQTPTAPVPLAELMKSGRKRRAS